jgi:hypothetical protein
MAGRATADTLQRSLARAFAPVGSVAQDDVEEDERRRARARSRWKRARTKVTGAMRLMMASKKRLDEAAEDRESDDTEAEERDAREEWEDIEEEQQLQKVHKIEAAVFVLVDKALETLVECLGQYPVRCLEMRREMLMARTKCGPESVGFIGLLRRREGPMATMFTGFRAVAIAYTCNGMLEVLPFSFGGMLGLSRGAAKRSTIPQRGRSCKAPAVCNGVRQAARTGLCWTVPTLQH